MDLTVIGLLTTAVTVLSGVVVFLYQKAEKRGDQIIDIANKLAGVPHDVLEKIFALLEKKTVGPSYKKGGSSEV